MFFRFLVFSTWYHKLHTVCVTSQVINTGVLHISQIQNIRDARLRQQHVIPFFHLSDGPSGQLGRWGSERSPAVEQTRSLRRERCISSAFVILTLFDFSAISELFWRTMLPKTKAPMGVTHCVQTVSSSSDCFTYTWMHMCRQWLSSGLSISSIVLFICCLQK